MEDLQFPNSRSSFEVIILSQQGLQHKRAANSHIDQIFSSDFILSEALERLTQTVHLLRHQASCLGRETVQEKTLSGQLCSAGSMSTTSAEG